MSNRNPEYQFVTLDANEIESQLTSIYEKMTNMSIRPASPEKIFVQFVASVIVQLRAQINYAGNQNVPSRADGENLDALAELFYIPARPAAKPAVCTCRFYISEAQDHDVLIQVGTRCTDIERTLYWATTDDVYVKAGDLYVETTLECQVAGTIGNGYAAGQINTLVDLFDYYSRCESTTVSDGGSNAATDDEYYEMMRTSMDAYSTAGAIGSYIYWAKQVSTEIADVIATSPSDAVVHLYAIMKDGSLAGEEIKKAILEACSAAERRPLTDHVVVEDAELVKYNIDFTYYIQSDTDKSSADIEKDVNAAVQKYVEWQCARMGRDINPDKMREFLADVGIKRIVLTEPEFKALKKGEERGSAPQLASINTMSVKNGGFEDE